MAIDTAPTARASAYSQLTRAQFIRLITYRRTGDAVATPVWFALDGNTIYVETSLNAGKVKRIRHTPHVGLAPSDARGRVTGPMTEGTARILVDNDEIAHADATLAHKYGWQHTLYFGALDLMRRLARKPGLRSVYLAITLARAD